MFDKTKKWIKNHKREIVVGAAAVGGTAMFFILKEKNLKPLNARLNLSVRLFSGDGSGDDYYNSRRNSIYTNINLNRPELKLSDLGKLTEVIKAQIPGITSDVTLEHLNINYSMDAMWNGKEL